LRGEEKRRRGITGWLAGMQGWLAVYSVLCDLCMACEDCLFLLRNRNELAELIKKDHDNNKRKETNQPF
jgi:hypothetical protein